MQKQLKLPSRVDPPLPDCHSALIRNKTGTIYYLFFVVVAELFLLADFTRSKKIAPSVQNNRIKVGIVSFYYIFISAEAHILCSRLRQALPLGGPRLGRCNANFPHIRPNFCAPVE